MIVSAIQSSYLPWRGYFDIIAASDLFIFYDGVPYSRGTWRNRNRFLGANGAYWLTVPVQAPAGTLIRDVRVDGSAWAARHARALEQSYAGAPYWREFGPELCAAYREWSMYRTGSFLYSVDRVIIEWAVRVMGIRSKLTDDERFGDLGDLRGTARLLEVLRRAGATTYISGPAGMNYFSREDFDRAGIELVIWDYSKLPPYPQRWAERLGVPFLGEVSVIDLLANVGPANARGFLTADAWRRERGLV